MSWGAYSSVPPIVEAILSTDDLRLSSLALMAAIASALLVTEACAASKLSLPIIVRIFSSDLRRRTELGVGWSSMGIGSRRLGVGVRREGLAHRQQSVSAGFAQLTLRQALFWVQTWDWDRRLARHLLRNRTLDRAWSFARLAPTATRTAKVRGWVP